MAKIAFLGLGVMGYPMAGHLATAGHKVTVYNRTLSKAKKWNSEFKGSIAETPYKAVKDVDFVMSCVGNDNDLLDITIGENGAFPNMKKGALFIDHTTVSAQVTEKLEADEIVEIIQELPEKVIGDVLKAMSSQNRELVSKDLSFAKATAGRMMNPDVVVVRPSHTIEVIRRYLRIRDELPQDMDKVFVVNRNNILRGNLPLTKILSAKSSDKAEDLMIRKFHSLLATDSEKEVDRLFERNHLISAPVINNEGELLGRITIDDVIDSIKEEVDQPFRQISGLSRDTFQETFLALRSRGLWLGANLITALLASSVINLFQGTIEKVIFLAVLMPIIASMGGVAATQTLAITVRGLALGQIVSGNIRWILSRELIVSFWNGLFWSIILGLIASFWFKDFDIFLIIIFSMTINLIAAALSGISIPLVLRKLKFDPAIGGGVIVTTVTDIVGFFTFLGVASIVYA